MVVSLRVDEVATVRFTSYDEYHCLVRELLELHTLSSFLVFMIQEQFEDIVWAFPILLQFNSIIDLRVNILPELLVVRHDAEKQKRCKTPLLDLGLCS